MNKNQQLSLTENDGNECLRKCVENTMEQYFSDLNGSGISNLYDLFLAEVEQPFYTVVMQASKGNLTLAAKWLGIHRNTLKSRLKKYKLL